MWRYTVKRACFLLTFLLPLVWAGAKPQPRLTPACANCPRILGLQKKFDAYRYANLDDRDKGAADVATVDGMIQDFVNNKAPNSGKTEEFKALVKLIASALPYDEETSLADSLNDLIQDDTLKKAYKTTLGEISDTCRREFLASAVAQHGCVEEHRDAGKYENPLHPESASSCANIETMDFDECVSKGEKKSESKIKRK
jgi:hypothetical protein